MIGGVVIAVVVVVVIPVGFLMSTSIGAAAIGALLNLRAREQHADSELIDTNY